MGEGERNGVGKGLRQEGVWKGESCEKRRNSVDKGKRRGKYWNQFHTIMNSCFFCHYYRFCWLGWFCLWFCWFLPRFGYLGLYRFLHRF